MYAINVRSTDYLILSEILLINYFSISTSLLSLFESTYTHIHIAGSLSGGCSCAGCSAVKTIWKLSHDSSLKWWKGNYDVRRYMLHCINIWIYKIFQVSSRLVSDSTLSSYELLNFPTIILKKKKELTVLVSIFYNLCRVIF